VGHLPAPPTGAVPEGDLPVRNAAGRTSTPEAGSLLYVVAVGSRGGEATATGRSRLAYVPARVGLGLVRCPVGLGQGATRLQE
ncbi:hypothetical protein DK295_15600, partial [Listeria monocytogenes]